MRHLTDREMSERSRKMQSAYESFLHSRNDASRPVFLCGPDESMSYEERVTDPNTGGMKGTKLAQLGAVDPAALMEVGKVAGYGSRKYERLNFLKGYAWSLSYDALQRHLHAFWDGEDNDPESGLAHLAHAAWHCLCLLAFSRRKLGTDDRYHSKG